MNEEKFITPMATVTERPEEYEFKITMPGIAKDEVELNMDGRTLTLKTHSKYQNPAGFRQVAAEFERTDYAMSVDLPELADPKALTAKMENGVLFVIVKKRPETKAKRIEIG
ncbi:MAG: Hsp20/alpha crystallin family protein [Kiritimatiellae bacterium]|nr:Hsp20/alpha crystallin family protein [Kiritimatiellia bacterium]